MKPKRPCNPKTLQSPTSGPLTDLIEEELNKSVADQIVEKLDDTGEEPTCSDASDYAHGTAEHEDDVEA